MSAAGPRFAGKDVTEWRRNTSHDITFSNNLAAEGLADASHPKGEHSKGSLVHDNTTGILFYRNIWAHNVERRPLVKGGAQAARSEEHTSELQSLMRISYAVFCLNKKKI